MSTKITVYFKDKERDPEEHDCSFVKVFGSFLMLVKPGGEENTKLVLTYPADVIDRTVSTSKVSNKDRKYTGESGSNL